MCFRNADKRTNTKKLRAVIYIMIKLLRNRNIQSDRATGMRNWESDRKILNSNGLNWICSNRKIIYAKNVHFIKRISKPCSHMILLACPLSIMFINLLCISGKKNHRPFRFKCKFGTCLEKNAHNNQHYELTHLRSLEQIFVCTMWLLLCDLSNTKSAVIQLRMIFATNLPMKAIKYLETLNNKQGVELQ